MYIRKSPLPHPLTIVPGNDASQMGAHSVDTVLLDGALAGNDEVGSLTLKALSQVVIANGMSLKPLGGLHRERSKIYALAVSIIAPLYSSNGILSSKRELPPPTSKFLHAQNSKFGPQNVFLP